MKNVLILALAALVLYVWFDKPTPQEPTQISWERPEQMLKSVQPYHETRIITRWREVEPEYLIISDTVVLPARIDSIVIAEKRPTILLFETGNVENVRVLWWNPCDSLLYEPEFRGPFRAFHASIAECSLSTEAQRKSKLSFSIGIQATTLGSYGAELGLSKGYARLNAGYGNEGIYARCWVGFGG